MRVYLTKPLMTIALLGFVSGLPFSLSFGTLSFWLAEETISKSSIGLFAFVGTPYVIKFLWAPAVDHLPVKFLDNLLGRRRSWIFCSQLGVILSIVVLGSLEPQSQLAAMALFALILVIFSASQDIAIDAYRIEFLSREDNGPGSGAIVFGWRIGALFSGAGTLYLAEIFGWAIAYYIMAACMMGMGVLFMLLAPEPDNEAHLKSTPSDYKQWFNHAVLNPLHEFTSRHKWWLILIFIILFKLGDAVALSMLNPFAVDLGFSKVEFATITKVYGVAATLFGCSLGGILIARYGVIKGLWVSGILQMISTLAFVWQASVGYNTNALIVTISLENIAGGLGTAAFIAYLSNLCNKTYTATQYALFSSMSAIARTWVSGSSGFLVEALGWSLFFTLCSLSAIPGLILLYYISKFYKDRYKI